jgi:hypothetical protein
MRLLFTIVVWATTYFFGARFRIVMKFRKKHCYKFNDFEKNAKIWAQKKEKKGNKNSQVSIHASHR